MTINEIKKELYKQKPIAVIDYERADFIYYSTLIIVDGMEEILEFKVPRSEKFEDKEIPAQLLIRWLVN